MSFQYHSFDIVSVFILAKFAEAILQHFLFWLSFFSGYIAMIVTQYPSWETTYFLQDFCKIFQDFSKY